MDDFRKALLEISASVSENAIAVSELRRWNEMYGEGGNRKKTLSLIFENFESEKKNISYEQDYNEFSVSEYEYTKIENRTYIY